MKSIQSDHFILQVDIQSMYSFTSWLESSNSPNSESIIIYWEFFTIFCDGLVYLTVSEEVSLSCKFPWLLFWVTPYKEDYYYYYSCYCYYNWFECSLLLWLVLLGRCYCIILLLVIVTSIYNSCYSQLSSRLSSSSR